MSRGGKGRKPLHWSKSTATLITSYSGKVKVVLEDSSQETVNDLKVLCIYRTYSVLCKLNESWSVISQPIIDSDI